MSVLFIYFSLFLHYSFVLFNILKIIPTRMPVVLLQRLFAADRIYYRDFLCGYNANISSNHIGRSYSSFVFVCLVVESCFVHVCLFSLLRYLFYNNNNYICITLKKIFLHTFLVVCKKWQLFEYIFSTF